MSAREGQFKDLYYITFVFFTESLVFFGSWAVFFPILVFSDQIVYSPFFPPFCIDSEVLGRVGF